MYAGRIVEKAPTQRLFSSHQHRYTSALFGAIPTFDTEKHSRLETIEGTPPNLSALPPGCAFSPRCKYSTPDCDLEVPPMIVTDDPTHEHACINPVGMVGASSPAMLDSQELPR